MNLIRKIVVAALAAGVLAVAAPVAANATTLYDDPNYVGFLWSGTTSGSWGIPVGANDKTSSFTNGGFETYCENYNCSGRTLNWTGNANSLGAISSGLHFGETWSDRISGVK